MCEAEGAGAGDSASRKSPSDGKTEFSMGASDAGNGVGLVSPLQLAKITASVLTPKTADRILMQASDVMFSKIGTVSKQTLPPVFPGSADKIRANLL